MGGFLKLLSLAVAVVAAVACSAPDDDPDVASTPNTASSPPADQPVTREAQTEAECRTAVLNDLQAPTTAEWGTSEVRDFVKGSLVLRGTATAQNARGVPITHRFVCMFIPDAGRIQVYFRSTDRAMYDEIVRLAGF